MKLFEKIFFRMLKKKVKKMFRNCSGKLSKKQVVMMLVGILIAVTGFLKKTFGLEIDPAVVFTGMVPAAAYVFGQLKNDLQKLKNGWMKETKLKDPKFWTALIASILPVVADVFGVEMSLEVSAGVAGVITTFLARLFWKKQKTLKRVNVSRTKRR